MRYTTDSIRTYNSDIMYRHTSRAIYRQVYVKEDLGWRVWRHCYWDYKG